ncbi:uncharacterized protein BDZ99DRAFT_514627 [Mytilinidion resinicola]|uniref:MFS general substrate transporter n=1 Tax=Mytilinidion resinicola TaxID=574789 RepID=A0A6A6Z5K3_9PEZI|nr:uncharacterized protein BDZ99DRAFT_514627 [Mytilinidion resinicola]KAF2816009.1 hypothetical protein BDZ99DRAFT_514627 [Mytilinidion resinicola]
MLTATVTSWQGLYAQRLLLGFVESIIPTGSMCIISEYYTQSEQALRQAWWFSAAALFTIIGNALNYGFAQFHGGMLKPPQYIYLLAGSLKVVFGLMCFATPNSPRLCLFPGGGISFIGCITGGWLASPIPSIRLLLSVFYCLPVIAGCAMIWKSNWTHHAPTPVAGTAIIGCFGDVTSLSMVAGMANVASATKKSVMAAAIFGAVGVGYIVGPQLAKSQCKAKHYPELWEGLMTR